MGNENSILKPKSDITVPLEGLKLIGWSTDQGCQSSPFADSLRIPSRFPRDMRIKVEDPTHEHYIDCGRLRIQFGAEEGSGTAFVVAYLPQHGSDVNHSFLLTAAHNFRRISGSEQLDYDAAFFYHPASPDIPRRITQCVLYPKYKTGDPTWDGYDFAVASFDKEGYVDSVHEFSEFVFSPIYSLPRVGDRVQLWGYPGEKQKEMYQMDGKISRIEKRSGGHVLVHYEDMQTTHGQSGSPLALLISPAELQRRWDEDAPVFEWTLYKSLQPSGKRSKKIIVGIHVASNQITHIPCATLCTTIFYDWMKSAAEMLFRT